MNNRIEISVVSPVYMAGNIVRELVSQIEKHTSLITQNFEIILVEDGSPDHSWEEIEKLARENKRVKGVQLSRNFGQHPAIFAGLKQARGKWIVVMDCDLQDNPAAIPDLHKMAIEDGHDKVLVRRKMRQDSFLKKSFSRLFYKLYGYLTNSRVDSRVANFGIYRKAVIDSVLLLQDKQKAFPLMVNWVGFKTGYLDVEHQERYEGKSSYNYSKLIKLATDISLSFSQKPILLTVRIGFLISSLSVLYGLILILLYFRGIIEVSGYTSIIVSIWFLSGLIIFFLGVVGMYIARIFEGVKNRPESIIRQKLNFDE